MVLEGGAWHVSEGEPNRVLRIFFRRRLENVGPVCRSGRGQGWEEEKKKWEKDRKAWQVGSQEVAGGAWTGSVLLSYS